MKKLLFLFVALVATTTLWASNTITYTATEKLPETTDEWSGGLHTNAFNVAITSHEFSNGTGTITFAGEVTTIGNRAFLNCYDLISVTIPNSVTKIGEGAFSWNSNLTLITIPKSVTTIGEGAFAYCSGLTSIYVEAGNTHYCSVDGVLFNYAKDTLIQYPASNSRIEYIIPNSVTTIENHVFYRCSGLISVFIPNSVTTIGETAFQECGSLASIDVDAANIHYCSIDGVLFNYTEDMLIQYPVGNTRTEYTIPNLVTTIEYGAFAYCNSLTSVTIPNSVTMIEYQAFYGSGVKNVEVAWTSEEQLPSMGWGAFESIANWAGPSYATLHVQEGTKSIYENADQWKDFGTITDSQVDEGNEIDMKPFIKYENQTGTFDYPYYPSWSDNSGKLRIFRDNGLQDLNLEAGVSKIVFYKTASTTGQIWIGDPNWNQLATVLDWDGGLTTLEYVLDEAAIKCITDETSDGWSGTAFILMGDGLEVTKIAIVPGTDQTPVVGKQFVDAISGLKFEITAVGEVNNVKVISNNGVDPTYSGDIVIPSIVNYKDITFTVTQIGSNAFSECTSPTSITIPNSVTTIGDDAFYLVNNIVYNGTATGSPWGAKCVNGYVDGYFVYSDASKTILCGCSTAAMGEITIPNSVIIIGESAFHYCRDLTSVTIPNSVITIGDYAFYKCSGLTSVTIGNSVTTIGEWVFYSCSSLTSVTIPNSVTTIGEGAFNGCSGLTSITIPNSVTTIEMQAFAWCSSLTSISIPNSVTKIEAQAFSWSGLRDVSVAWTSSDQLPTMGVGVFDYIANWEAPSAATLHVPEGTKSIYEAADQWKDFGTITDKQYDPKNCVITYTATEKLPEVPDEWCGGLHTNAFNVAIISHEFFNGIGTITFAGEVTTIGDEAFNYCSYLTSIAIPNSVTWIAEDAFYGCTGLTSVTIPNSVTTIGDWAFLGCSSLTSVTIPNSVTTIGEGAFAECYGLTSINVDAANTHYCSIDGVLFNYAKDTLIQYPIGNTRTEYTIPHSVTTIGRSAFYGCSGLTSITIPNSVTSIGDYAFYNCSGLTSVTIPNSVTTIGGGTFAECSGLTSITIPNSVTTIGISAFFDCSGLTSITIPNSVTKIGYQAFFDCSGLTSVTIGNSVTTIEYLAFYRCSGLTSVTCYAVTPPKCDSYAFDYINQDTKVYVLASSLSAYQSADVWKDLNLFPLGADVKPLDDENPIVIPTDQDVTITWAITGGADTYTLTITKDGETVCVLTFNADGQLTNIVFAAPGHNGARQAPAATRTTQGFQFTVTGLDPGTAYEYSVTTTNAEGQTIAEQKGNFNTTGGESGLQNVRNGVKASKYFQNGNLIIERNGVKYTPAGQKVR